ncbi:MAG: hypothetical protein IKP96_06300 [Elusimicrobiaceae bacterium]|nr:hypothetical protein [Elusimicrobiaceae bacterium]
MYKNNLLTLAVLGLLATPAFCQPKLPATSVGNKIARQVEAVTAEAATRGAISAGPINATHVKPQPQLLPPIIEGSPRSTRRVKTKSVADSSRKEVVPAPTQKTSVDKPLTPKEVEDISFLMPGLEVHPTVISDLDLVDRGLPLRVNTPQQATKLYQQSAEIILRQNQFVYYRYRILIAIATGQPVREILSEAKSALERPIDVSEFVIPEERLPEILTPGLGNVPNFYVFKDYPILSVPRNTQNWNVPTYDPHTAMYHSWFASPEQQVFGAPLYTADRFDYFQKGSLLQNSSEQFYDREENLRSVLNISASEDRNVTDLSFIRSQLLSAAQAAQKWMIVREGILRGKSVAEIRAALDIRPGVDASAPYLLGHWPSYAEGENWPQILDNLCTSTQRMTRVFLEQAPTQP